MSKPSARRSEFAGELSRRRRPSMAAMDRAAEELERERSAAPSSAEQPAGEKPEILLPEQEGHPHGQLVVAYNPATGETWGFNFVEHPWRDDDSIRDMNDLVDEFAQHGTLNGGPAKRLEFRSPHDGQLHCLTREGARRVLGVNHARTMGQVAPHSDQVALVRVRPELLIPPGVRRPA